MRVVIEPTSFAPYELLAKHQSSLQAGSYGAVVSFVGVMRDFNDDENITAMTLEHYPGMTERAIERVSLAALTEYSIDDVLVVHRVGNITPDEPIVLVAIWSAHRAAAFDACRYVINDLKQHAPFWKQEKTTKGARWVTGNSKDLAADKLK